MSIHDGDSLTLRTAAATVRVRLTGIDAPELGQPFGKKAREALGRLCFGRSARVRARGVDAYGRILADLYVSAGSGSEIWVNHELVRRGLAWHFKRYSTDPVLAEAEARAREEGSGLWADLRPVAPWDYRRRYRFSSGARR